MTNVLACLLFIIACLICLLVWQIEFRLAQLLSKTQSYESYISPERIVASINADPMRHFRPRRRSHHYTNVN